MTRRPETIAFWKGRLPHWEVEDGRYFVTIHLAGAIPAVGKRRIRSLADEFDAPSTTNASSLKLQRKIFREMESWLDRTDYLPHLAEPEVAAAVMEAIDHRTDIGVWNVFEYVVMPNHLHMFFELCQPGLKEVLEEFKRWTGRESNRILGFKEQPFWQREWFDHWSRSDEEDDRIVRYIRQNPEKAGLVETYLDWKWRG